MNFLCLLVLVLISVLFVDRSAAFEVTSPRKGDIWSPCGYNSINWTIDYEVKFVVVEYSDDGGESFNVILNRTRNVFYMEWRVPCSAKLGTKNVVRVVSTANFSIFAESNMFTFSKPIQVEITKPKRTPPVAYVGEPITIKWSSHSDTHFKYVDLLLVDIERQTLVPLGEKLGRDGQMTLATSWRTMLSDGIACGDSTDWIVSAFSHNYPYLGGESGNFQFLDFFNVSSPKKFDVFLSGKDMINIGWSWALNLTHVDIDLSYLDVGTKILKNVSTLAKNLKNIGSASLLAPKVPDFGNYTDVCSFHLTILASEETGLKFDSLSEPFCLLEEKFEVSISNSSSSNVLFSGSKYRINWSQNPGKANVTEVGLYLCNVTQTSTPCGFISSIAVAMENVGELEWTVPAMDFGWAYRVVVFDTAEESVKFGLSKEFEIRRPIELIFDHELIYETLGIMEIGWQLLDDSLPLEQGVVVNFYRKYVLETPSWATFASNASTYPITMANHTLGEMNCSDWYQLEVCLEGSQPGSVFCSELGSMFTIVDRNIVILRPNSTDQVVRYTQKQPIVFQVRATNLSRIIDVMSVSIYLRKAEDDILLDAVAFDHPVECVEAGDNETSICSYEWENVADFVDIEGAVGVYLQLMSMGNALSARSESFDLVPPFIIQLPESQVELGYLLGETINITWATNVPDSANNISIDLYILTQHVMCLQCEVTNKGSLLWTIPLSMRSYSHGYPLSNHLQYAVSISEGEFVAFSQPFSLIANGTTITSPNSSSEWVEGNEYEIEWLVSDGILSTNHTDVSIAVICKDVKIVIGFERLEARRHLWQPSELYESCPNAVVEVMFETSFSEEQVFFLSEEFSLQTALSLDEVHSASPESFYSGDMYTVSCKVRNPKLYDKELSLDLYYLNRTTGEEVVQYVDHIDNFTCSSSGSSHKFVLGKYNSGAKYLFSLSLAHSGIYTTYSDEAVINEGIFFFTNTFLYNSLMRSGFQWTTCAVVGLEWLVFSNIYYPEVTISLVSGDVNLGTIATDIKNMGHFDWVIWHELNAEGPVESYRFHLTAPRNFTTALSAPFSPLIRFEQLDRSSTVVAGESFVVSFQDNYVLFAEVEDEIGVDIQLWNEWRLVESLCNNVSGPIGSCNWDIQSKLDPGYYHFKFISADNSSIYSNSPQFRCGSKRIDIYYPSERVPLSLVWYVGSIISLIWEESSLEETSTLQIQLIGRYSEYDLAMDVPNTGNYSFYLPSSVNLGESYTLNVSLRQDFFSFTEIQSISILPSIVVYTPGIGDTLQKGNRYEMAWYVADPNLELREVNIYLNKDGTRISVIAMEEKNSNSYSWVVSSDLNPAYDSYSFVIVNADDSNIQAESNRFTIVGSFFVLSPASISVWRGGQDEYIEWSIDHSIKNVTIELHLWGQLHEVLFASVPNDGIIRWSVRDSLLSSTEYSIIIRSTNDSCNFAVSPTFSIMTNKGSFPSISSPEADAMWEMGKINVIEWESIGAVDMVNISLFRNEKPLALITNGSSNFRSYHWRIPHDFEEGGEYQVLVGSVGNYYTYNLSGEFFLVSPILIDSPMAGSAWKEEDLMEIMWETRELVHSVDIVLRRQSDKYFSYVIATSYDSPEDIYYWEVPDLSKQGMTSGDDYVIRISDSRESEYLYGESGGITVNVMEKGFTPEEEISILVLISVGIALLVSAVVFLMLAFLGGAGFLSGIIGAKFTKVRIDMHTSSTTGDVEKQPLLQPI